MAPPKKKVSPQKRCGKTRYLRRWVVGGAALLCVLCAALLMYHSLKPLELPYLTARNVVVLDGETGRLRYDKMGDVPHSPSSLTKMMTMLLVFEQIEQGNLAYDDTFVVTEKQAHCLGSKCGLMAGETVSVDQLLAGTILVSGCDAVACLVEMTYGSEAAFVAQMNEKAQELHLSGTHYANATGIDAADHYMTARDIAQLGYVLVQEYPDYLKYSSSSEMEFRGKHFKNINRLVGADSRVLGLKTGTTMIGGESLTTYARKDGKSCIVVLLDANNNTAKFAETERILDKVLGGK